MVCGHEGCTRMYPKHAAGRAAMGMHKAGKHKLFSDAARLISGPRSVICDEDFGTKKNAREHFKRPKVTCNKDERVQHLLRQLEEGRELRVAKLMRLIEVRRFDRLRAANISPADVQVVRKWSRGLIRTRRARMIALIPETVRQHLESLPDERRQLEWLFRFYLQPRCGVARRHPELLPTRQELIQLAADLSARAGRALRDAGDSRQQLRLIEQWYRAWGSRTGFPGERRTLKLDVLERFYDEELSPRERERLDRFRGRRFRDQLTERYFNRPGGRRGRAHREEAIHRTRSPGAD